MNTLFVDPEFRFRVTFDIFGTYTWGKLAGRVNPKANARVTYYGKDFKDCRDKLVKDTDGAFFKPCEVVDRAVAVIERLAVVVAE